MLLENRKNMHYKIHPILLCRSRMELGRTCRNKLEDDYDRLVKVHESHALISLKDILGCDSVIIYSMLFSIYLLKVITSIRTNPWEMR